MVPLGDTNVASETTDASSGSPARRFTGAARGAGCFRPPPEAMMRSGALGLEHDVRDRVDLPDGRDVLVQALGTGSFAMRMRHVEEQRAFDLDRNGRVVEII